NDGVSLAWNDPEVIPGEIGVLRLHPQRVEQTYKLFRGRIEAGRVNDVARKRIGIALARQSTRGSHGARGGVIDGIREYLAAQRIQLSTTQRCGLNPEAGAETAGSVGRDRG